MSYDRQHNAINSSSIINKNPDETEVLHKTQRTEDNDDEETGNHSIEFSTSRRALNGHINAQSHQNGSLYDNNLNTGLTNRLINNGEAQYNQQEDYKIKDLPDTSADLPYRPEPVKTLISAFTLIGALLLNLLSLAIVHDYTFRDNVLPDVVLSNIKAQRWAMPTADAIQFFLILSTLTLTLLLHHRRMIVTRRYLTILTVLYVLRIPSLLVTILPTTVHGTLGTCSPGNPNSTFVDIMMRTPDGGMLCGDLLYSGHTCQITTAMLVICRYSPKSWPGWWLLRLMICVIGCFGLVCLVVSFGHYTVDVYIALLLAVFVFNLYHAFVDKSPIDLANTAYWPILPVYFMEANVSHVPFDNMISWPFKQPRFLVLFCRRLNQLSSGNCSRKHSSMNRKAGSDTTDSTS